MDNDGQIVIGDAMPDTSIPVLSDGPPMDLPTNATLNADGSVTLVFDYPCAVVYKTPGTGEVVNRVPYTSLTLRRLTGADVRKMAAAKDSAQMGLALSSGLGLAKLNLLNSVMDATDEAAAGRVVSELLGGFAAGLPPHATSTPDGVTLPLFYPCEDEAGAVHTEMVFKRLTAFQRKKIGAAPNLLDWAVAEATGLTPKLAASLVDRMDGVDAVGVNQVILFLLGSGR